MKLIYRILSIKDCPGTGLLCETVFEFVAEGLGAQNTVCAGGRI